MSSGEGVEEMPAIPGAADQGDDTTQPATKRQKTEEEPGSITAENQNMFVGIKKPGINDCILGRGGGTNHNPGNIKFRRIVEDQKSAYKASSRSDKPRIAMKIVMDWRALNPPGRFIKLNKATGLYDDIGDAAAKEKCAQALREKHHNKLWLDEEGKSAGFKSPSANDNNPREAVKKMSPAEGGGLKIPPPIAADTSELKMKASSTEKEKKTSQIAI